MGDRSAIEWRVSGGSNDEIRDAVVLHLGPVEVWLPWRVARDIGRQMIAVARREQRDERYLRRLRRTARHGR